MTEEQYLLLCEKYFRGECSPEELAKIASYQKRQGLNNISFEQQNQAEVRDALFNRVHDSIAQNVSKPVWFRSAAFKVAASLAAALIVFFYFAIRPAKDKVKPAVAKVIKNQINDIPPGSANAILTLANGKSIKLNDQQNGLISQQEHAAISKSGTGIILTAKNTDANESNLAFNKISVPRAGKYNITLSDGTKIWLNASSSLSFPTVFSGQERKVRLTGEAYFEVAKNKKMPFIIDVNGKQEVEVLGTHFNITAFDDDKDITTALLEGSVRVHAKTKQVLIKPGEMVVNNLKDNLSIRKADLDEIMAWKNDMFVFSNENITSVMKKIARWYDVEVSYKGDMANMNIDGNYSRAKGLKSLLKNIELLDKVDFQVKERRVTVIAK
ncbi:FecR family protein [Pedobacter rhodius]|uniref:FecR domain-containing protein n=1 Tax=Pedobacter rhodius TaxID=3004098 RepID=A0ABT4KUP2_9SPHI|nr:FecR family protein [Pedobacter sp. SJ11]MCZ4221957.1 FecR domain-containing protein [Pedobacter sp. SJ11]